MLTSSCKKFLCDKTYATVIRLRNAREISFEAVPVQQGTSRVHWPLDFKLPVPDLEGDVRRVLWNQRHLDLLGQIVILLAAVFGVLVLFKESKDER